MSFHRRASQLQRKKMELEDKLEAANFVLTEIKTMAAQKEAEARLAMNAVTEQMVVTTDDFNEDFDFDFNE